MTYDIVIVGLGPAGATLARFLKPSLKVLAIDKKDEKSASALAPGKEFRKPCGGLLAPDAQKILARLGLTVPIEVLVNPQIFAVKTIDLEADITNYYQRFYLNLDRHKFDLWLISLIPPHVNVALGSRFKSVKKTDDGYFVEYESNSESFNVKTKYVVGADGANSKIRKAIYGDRRIKEYVSIQQWFYDCHSTPFYSSIFDSSITDCYCWGLSKNEYFILGGAFPKRDSQKRLERLKERLCKHGFIFGEVLRTEACMVLRPSGLFDCACGKDGIFLTGEAAGFISPSSLEGMSYAMDSAEKLSAVLNDVGEKPNSTYFRKTLSIRLKLFLKNAKIPFIFFRPFRFIVMKTGIQSMKMIERSLRR